MRNDSSLELNPGERYVSAENERITEQRAQLQRIETKIAHGGEPGYFDRRRMRAICRHYRLDDCDQPLDPEDLLVMVDIVPAELVLVQAAKESGWGTSRLARLSSTTSSRPPNT